MWKITAYWFLDADGKKSQGHDTFTNNTELSEYELDLMIDKMLNSDSPAKAREFEEKLPNFRRAATGPHQLDDWGIRKIVQSSLHKDQMEAKTE